jgi:prevent-host-death family protein
MAVDRVFYFNRIYPLQSAGFAPHQPPAYRMYMGRAQVSVVLLRSRLAAVLQDVERGAEVLITRSGRAVAKLVPVADPDAQLRAAGVQLPSSSVHIPRVKPVRLSRGASLTRSVLEARD